MATIQVKDATGVVKTVNTINPNGQTTAANSAPVVLASDHGNIPVNVNTLMAGEDQDRDWLKVASGATQYYVVAPKQTIGGPAPNTKILGLALGLTGDYLKAINVIVRTATNSAVYLQDGAIGGVTSGTSGTAPSGNSVVTVTTASTTLTANQYAGAILTITYTPTSGASATFKRRIVSHPAVSAGTSIAFTVSHDLPAGASITEWIVDHSSSFELLPPNLPVGTYNLLLEMVSVNGGWKVTVDSGAQVIATGLFT